jgi:hypothetical protein
MVIPSMVGPARPAVPACAVREQKPGDERAKGPPKSYVSEWDAGQNPPGPGDLWGSGTAQAVRSSSPAAFASIWNKGPGGECPDIPHALVLTIPLMVTAE